MKTEKKIFDFKFETKSFEEKTEKGLNIGIIKGYASTYNNIDKVDDIMKEGCFEDTLKEQSGTILKMLSNHSMWDVIGGFPVEEMKDDSKGLFVVGHINLDVAKGKETYALAKQGVINKMSIGFRVKEEEFIDDGKIRLIKKCDLFEISIVPFPANPEANILNVKTVVPYQNLSLADREREWDKTSALKRVRAFTDSEEEASKSYKKAFMWFDKENEENLTAYKLPIADVVGGQLKAIPRAIFAVAGALKGARGGVDIPQSDKQKIISSINKYYAKMRKEFDDDSIVSPFLNKNIDDFTELKEVENCLKDNGFSQKECKAIISKINSLKEKDVDDKKGLNQRDVDIDDEEQRDVVLQKCCFAKKICRKLHRKFEKFY